MQPIFMIKFGKRAHLQQIVEGRIRFSPIENYVKLEEQQQIKGQGDKLEAKLPVYLSSSKNALIDWGNLLGNVPIFCLSQYGEEDIKKETTGKNYSIAIRNEILEQVKLDFVEADYALVILEPEVFIQDITMGLNRAILVHEIMYFDYTINDMDMFEFLANDRIVEYKEMDKTKEDLYKFLFCKNKNSFEKQQEYRVAILDEKIVEPKFYDFQFNSKYMLIPISELLKCIPVKL